MSTKILDKECIQNLINQGKTNKEIVEIIGCEPKTLTNTLSSWKISNPNIPPSVTEQNKDQIIDLYVNQNKNPKDIGAMFGITQYPIYNAFKRWGIKAQKNNNKIHVDNPQINIIKDMSSKGLSLQAMSNELGISKDVIYRVTKENDIQLKTTIKVRHTVPCKYCSKEFAPANANHKFCSNTCHQNFLYPKQEEISAPNSQPIIKQNHDGLYICYLCKTPVRSVEFKNHRSLFHKNISEYDFLKTMYSGKEPQICKKEGCGKYTNWNHVEKKMGDYCSIQCRNTDSQIIEKTKQTRVNNGTIKKVEEKIIALEPYGPLINDINYENKEWIYHLYFTLNKSFRQIAEEYSISHKIARNRVEKLGIKKDKDMVNKSISERTKEYEISIDWLKDKLYDSNVSDIAKEIGCSPDLIQHYKKTNGLMPTKEEVKDKIKRTFQKKYGQHPMKTEEIKNKLINTNLNKYGVRSTTQVKEFKDKQIKTIIERYGVSHFNKLPENRKIMSIRSRNFWSGLSQESRDKFNKKSYETRKRNNSFVSSKVEEAFHSFILKHYPNTKHPYTSDLYPFNCDFYIPELDLYIEINGTWTHGKEPFNPYNLEHLDIISKWKDKNTEYYHNAIDNWTKRDPYKRQIALNNNLRFLEIWSSDLLLGTSHILSMIDKFKD